MAQHGKRTRRVLLVGLAIVLVAGLASFQYSRSWENAYFLDPLHRLPTDRKVVALTFDDGPSGTRTPALLELLRKHEVKATFFMLGENIEKHPEIARSVFEQGHLVGNHSYNHPRLVFRSPSFVRSQIARTDSLIRSLGQQDVRYFRPPYSSKYIVLPWVLRSMQKSLVTGSYDPPSEYGIPYDAEQVASEVIEHAKPGSIVYLHDGKSSDADPFVRSVERIILGLKDKGYAFARLDDPN